MAASEKARARYASDGGRPISERSLRRWVHDGFFTFHGPRQAVRISFSAVSPVRP